MSFVTIGDKFYLKISPEIILTYDGYEPIQGQREEHLKLISLTINIIVHI